MSWTLCTSSAAILKAGVNANSAITVSGAALAEWSNQAEGMVNERSRYDWIANYGSINTNFKSALADTVSSYIAMNIIAYDMSGYTSRAEAQTMLDFHRDIIAKNLEKLDLDEYKEKIGVV